MYYIYRVVILLFMGGYGTIRILMGFMRNTPKDENMFMQFAVEGSVGR